MFLRSKWLDLLYREDRGKVDGSEVMSAELRPNWELAGTIVTSFHKPCRISTSRGILRCFWLQVDVNTQIIDRSVPSLSWMLGSTLGISRWHKPAGGMFTQNHRSGTT